MTTVAIHQPNYFPWEGYFRKIHQADIFVFLDTAQFSKGSYTNRVKIAPNMRWMTVPILRAQGSFRPINETKISYSLDWQEKHLSMLREVLPRAPSSPLWPELEYRLYTQYKSLGAMNIALITWLVEEIGIRTQLVTASEFGESHLKRSERLIELCWKVGGDTYLSGQGARKYNDVALFAKKGIGLTYVKYPTDTSPYSFLIKLLKRSINR